MILQIPTHESLPHTKSLDSIAFSSFPPNPSRTMAAPESYVQKLQRAQTTVPVRAQLNFPDYCATNQIAQPQFQDYSDPRGMQPSALHVAPPFSTLTDSPIRYTDSLVQQCLRTRSRIPSPPLARLPLPRTVPRRSRRSRLESTQLRSSSYEHRGPDAIHPCLHDISITLRSLSHKTTTRLRGKGHSGLRTRQEATP